MRKLQWAGFAVLLFAGAVFLLQTTTHRHSSLRSAPPAPKLPVVPVTGEHYLIYSGAPKSQVESVSNAVESLFTAYSSFFAGMTDTPAAGKKLKLVLYRNREEFSRNNRSSPWAEAYYQAPFCYAYYGSDGPNRYHWMLHEATHQLNNELSRFPRTKWVDEGLATFFGASRIESGRMIPGLIDAHAYPIWWLSGLELSDNMDRDIAGGRIIPLRAIISGRGGPDIDSNVNLYYIEYWSLSHFLFKFHDGQYADAYKRLIREGGTVENFEKLIGPIERVQGEWYEYLRQRVDDAGGGEGRAILVN